MFINIRVLILRGTDWKSSLSFKYGIARHYNYLLVFSLFYLLPWPFLGFTKNSSRFVKKKVVEANKLDNPTTKNKNVS